MNIKSAFKYKLLLIHHSAQLNAQTSKWSNQNNQFLMKDFNKQNKTH